MWVFLMIILGISMYFLLGDVMRVHVPSTAWLFPSQAAVPDARLSRWKLEITPGDDRVEGDWRISLPGENSMGQTQSELVLTCISKKFSAHINPGTAVEFKNVGGTATTTLTFDEKIKRDWEQGKHSYLFPPNSITFVEKALGARSLLTVDAPIKDADPIRMQFYLDGLEAYRALLSVCGVTLPLQAVPNPAPPAKP